MQEQKAEAKKRKWHEVAKKGESIMQLRREINTAEAAAKTAEKIANKCSEEGQRATLRQVQPPPLITFAINVFINYMCRLESTKKQFRQVSSEKVEVTKKLKITGEKLQEALRDKEILQGEVQAKASHLEALEDAVEGLHARIVTFELQEKLSQNKLKAAQDSLNKFKARRISVSKFRRAANAATSRADALWSEAEQLKDRLTSACKEAASKTQLSAEYEEINKNLKHTNVKLMDKLRLFQEREVRVVGYRRSVNKAEERVKELNQQVNIPVCVIANVFIYPLTRRCQR